MLNQITIQKYDKLFIGWSQKEIRQASKFIKFLENKNISITEFFEYESSIKKRIEQQNAVLKQVLFIRQQWFSKNGPKCPECGLLMSIGTVNAGKRDRVDNPELNSVFSCPDVKNCGYQKFEKDKAHIFINEYESEFSRYIESLSVQEILDYPIEKEIYDRFKGLADIIYDNKFLDKSDEIILPPCPECKTNSLGLFSVNIDPSNQVGGHFKSQLFCHNCGFDRYTRKSPGEFLKFIRRKGV